MGSGLGKPNIHVSLYPGVKYSVGIEMELTRWKLSLHNLRHLLESRVAPESGDGTPPGPYNVAFLHADMFKASTFDPFTHVYLFYIGMPPVLFLHMAECLRSSR